MHTYTDRHAWNQKYDIEREQATKPHSHTCTQGYPLYSTFSSHPSQQVQESKAKTWCANKGEIPYMETSAKEAINVESAFLAASHKALDKEQEPLKIENDQVIDINRDSSQGGGRGCCKKS